MTTAKGFTLLEVLVAMAIFAVIGLGANQMLRSIITTHEKTNIQIKGFSAVTKALTTLRRDMSQMVPRNIRDQYGDPIPALLLANGDYFLEFTRSGWGNPLGLPRSNLQRVAYEVNDEGELQRHFWLVLDRAEDSEPITQTLLEGVEVFRVVLLDERDETTNVWPNGESRLVIPRSAEVVIELEALGEIRQVVNFIDDLRASRNIQADGTQINDQDDQDDQTVEDSNSTGEQDLNL